jgi:tRNA threonylcarbamoyladenosine biosynthesis protein TsaB
MDFRTMKDYKFIAAIDMTGPFSSWCIADKDKKVIAKESIKLSRKSNSVFFDTFRKKLKSLDVDFKDISKWYVGAGPGSYTGIRVAAAFVSGILFCKEQMNVIGVPSYFPIAAELKMKDNEKIGVIFQVTHKSVLIYNVTLSDGVLTSDDAPMLYDEKNIGEVLNNYDKLATIVDLENNLLIKNSIIEDIIVLDSFPVERMIDKECCTNSRNIDDLIYTRPPVTTIPKK